MNSAAAPDLTVKDVCAALGRSRNTVLGYVHRGWLVPAVGRYIAKGSRGRPVGALSYRFTLAAVVEFQRGGPCL